jgi:hypothetical protein
MGALNEADAIHGGVAWRSCLLLSMLACGGSSDLSQPVDEPSSINVYTSTEGVDIDTDGYELSVDGGTPISVGATDTLIVSDLEPGPHTVALDGWAENCTPSASPSRRVEASPGEPSAVHFSVACTAAPDLVVRVTTVGVGGDVDGYQLALNGAEPELIMLADTIIYDALPAGEHEVALSGLQDNCSFEGPNPRLLSVAPGPTAVTDFEVRCSIPYRILFQSFTETSPTGEGISSLNIMNSDGSDLRTLISGPGFWGGDAAWSPDGTRIGYWRGKDLIIMASDGSGPTTIYTTPPGPDIYSGGVRWSPDGTRLAFGEFGHPGGQRLYVIRADGSDLSLLRTNAWDAMWAPDSRMLAFTTSESEERTDETDIYLIRPDGTGLRPLAATAGAEWMGRWSPDGANIAIHRTVNGAASGYDGPVAIYLVDPSTTGQRQLTSGPVDGALEWSPDGSKLLFMRQPLGRGANPEIHVINADGSEDVTLLDEALPGGHDGASWSPDGRAIAWGRTWGSETGIYIMNPDGSRKMRINGTNSAPRWEPAVPGSP